MKKPGGQLQYKVITEWSRNLAYAVGLIASDGCLRKDGRHIDFVSKDVEQVLHFKTALGIENKITRSGRGGETEKNYHHVSFGDKNFYCFLNTIGITAAKSKTIGQVSVPKEFFIDFIRGVFDGDGSFYASWDKRWANSLVYQISFASASKKFLEFIRSSLFNNYGLKGFYHNGSGVWEIRYPKGATKELFAQMYYPGCQLSLSRKYDKIRNILELDQELKLPARPVGSVFRFVPIMPR